MFQDLLDESVETELPGGDMNVGAHLRSALRNVDEGRRKVNKQRDLIEKLFLDGHPIQDAEDVLKWLMSAQRQFEENYRKLLSTAKGECS
jgi:hypothetical protein